MASPRDQRLKKIVMDVTLPVGERKDALARMAAPAHKWLRSLIDAATTPAHLKSAAEARMESIEADRTTKREDARQERQNPVAGLLRFAGKEKLKNVLFFTVYNYCTQIREREGRWPDELWAAWWEENSLPHWSDGRKQPAPDLEEVAALLGYTPLTFAEYKTRYMAG